MQHKVTSSLFVCLSENGFSLDELVYRMKDLFEKNAFGELLRHILLLVDEVLRLKVMQGKPVPVRCECGCEGLVLNGVQARTIRTGLGDINFERVSRVKCSKCGKTFAMLMRLLGVTPHQSKTSELEKLVLEEVAGDSYRRAHKSIQRMTGVTAGRSTFHNWMLRTAADEISVPENVIGSVPGEIFADGTKCKSIGADGKPERGDIKVMIGVNARGEVFPIGSWTHHESWDDVSRQIEARKLKFPAGTILVSDGEPGLADALSRHANAQQRCHWHLVRDTYHTMWQNGGTSKDARPVKDALKAVFAVELPKGDFQKVSEAEKSDIEERMEKAEGHIEKLIAYLRAKNYTAAADYLQRSKAYMFNYVRRWLSMGISCPRASSLIERTMREIARRVKNISYNWKPEGLGKVVKIVLKVFSQPEEWEKYWRERMNINQSVMLTFKILKT